MRLLRPALALRVSILGGAGVLAACTLGGGSLDSTGSAHTAGEIEWASTVPQMWAAVDRSTMDPYEREPLAPDGHIVEARVDAWVQHFDAIARHTIVAKTRKSPSAPAPFGRIVISKTPTIRVQRVPACVAGQPAGFAVDGGAPDAEAATDAAGVADADAGDSGAGDDADRVPMRSRDTLIMLEGKLQSFSTNFGGVTCVDAPDWRRADGLRWFNALGGLSVEDHGTYGIMNGANPDVFGPSAPQLSDRVAIWSAGPAVYVSSAMVSTLSETALAVAVAREIARYHRAHDTTATFGQLDYLFERSDAASRPAPITDEATTRAFRDARVPRFLIPTQKFHARLVPTLLRWVTDLSWDASHPCYAAKHFVTEEVGSAKTELLYDSFSPLSSGARSAILRWEPKVSACVDALELTSASYMPHATLTGADTKLPRAWFLEHIEAALKEAATGADLAAPTLRELVTRLEAVAEKIDDEASDVEKKIRENRLGYYTQAYEADAIALELGAASGIAPRKVFDAMFELMSAHEKADPSGYDRENVGVSVAECKSWFDAGFREVLPDGKERDIYVPFSTYPSASSWCPRVYELLREARTHAYAPAPLAGPFAPDSYGDVQKEATTLTSGAPPLPPPAPPVVTAADAGPSVVPKPNVTGTANDEWKNDGWTAPARPDTVPTQPSAQPKAADGGCAVAAPGASRAVNGWALGNAWLFVVAVALRRRSLKK